MELWNGISTQKGQILFVAEIRAELLRETMTSSVYNWRNNVANCKRISQIEVMGSVFPVFRFLSQRWYIFTLIWNLLARIGNLPRRYLLLPWITDNPQLHYLENLSKRPCFILLTRTLTELRYAYRLMCFTNITHKWMCLDWTRTNVKYFITKECCSPRYLVITE